MRIFSSNDTLAVRDFACSKAGVSAVLLRVVQLGGKHVDAKPLKGFRGTSVMEIVDDFDGDTYRAVYTVRFDEAVYVLHAFQKKSKHGIATPRHDITLIGERLKAAKDAHDRRMTR